MIFRHFSDEKTGSNSYLIACPVGRVAAIINPVESALEVDDYSFVGDQVLIGHHAGATETTGMPTELADQDRPTSAPSAPPPRGTPIRSFRSSREGICLERLILEDLHTSLAEKRFTPKEERVVLAYVGFLEQSDFDHPSATQLSDLFGNIDRTAVHVLVHNIRWKQIDLGRLPLVLAGQTSKWLKGMQTRPEFTAHEREFLRAYLRLVEAHSSPPSGPDVVRELGGHRSVQWVRKRAHTIRRKQRDFQLPVLELSRKGPEPAAAATHHVAGARPGHALRYGT